MSFDAEFRQALTVGRPISQRQPERVSAVA
jgi:hypothetical protein